MNGISTCVMSSSNAPMRSLVHHFDELRRAERFARKVRNDIPSAARVATSHDDDHRLRVAARDQVVEDEICLTLPDPSRFVLATAVL